MPGLIHGSLDTIVALPQLNDQNFNIHLHVLKDDQLATDLFLGRDFLDSHLITVIYKPVDKSKVAPPLAFSQMLLQVLACAEVHDDANGFEEIKIDFDPEYKQLLLGTLFDVENTHIESVDDDSTIKLKYILKMIRFSHMHHVVLHITKRFKFVKLLMRSPIERNHTEKYFTVLCMGCTRK